MTPFLILEIRLDELKQNVSGCKHHVVEVSADLAFNHQRNCEFKKEFFFDRQVRCERKC